MPEIKLLISQTAVMNNFCYGFTFALLKKLKQLVKENKAFLEGNKDPEDSTIYRKPTLICEAVLHQLNSQMKTQFHSSTKEVNDLISVTEEFLEIFREEA